MVTIRKRRKCMRLRGWLVIVILYSASLWAYFSLAPYYRQDGDWLIYGAIGMVLLVLVTIRKIFKWKREQQFERYNNPRLALRSRDRDQLMEGKKALQDIRYKKLR
jgi:hypothetical protein